MAVAVSRSIFGRARTERRKRSTAEFEVRRPNAGIYHVDVDACSFGCVAVDVVVGACVVWPDRPLVDSIEPPVIVLIQRLLSCRPDGSILLDIRDRGVRREGAGFSL
jgi:hypothetical protein